MTEAFSGPKRRHVLEALGVSAAAGLSGCILGSDGGSDDGDTTDGDSDDGDGGRSDESDDGDDSAGGDGSSSDGDGTGGEGTDPLGSNAWPMRNFDASHAGSHPAATVPATPLQEEWSVETAVERSAGSRYLPIVVDSGYVVTATPNGTIYAYEADTGAEAWTYELAGRSTAGGGIASYDGIVYASEDDFDADYPLYAIDVETGDVEWQTAAGQPFDPIVSNDAIYGARLRDVGAWDLTDGSELWTASVNGSENVAIAGGTLYTRDSDGEVWQIVAFDATTGDEQWRGDSYDVSSTPRASHLSVGDGTVYATNENGQVFAFDATSGSEQWQSDPYTDTERNTTDTYPREPPVIGDDNVYVGGFSVHALSRADGSESWSVGNTNDDRYYMAYVDGELVHLWEPGVVAYDPADGSERWQVQVPFERRGCLGDVAVAGGRLYVSENRCVGEAPELWAFGAQE